MPNQLVMNGKYVYVWVWALSVWALFICVVPFGLSHWSVFSACRHRSTSATHYRLMCWFWFTCSFWSHSQGLLLKIRFKLSIAVHSVYNHVESFHPMWSAAIPNGRHTKIVISSHTKITAAESSALCVYNYLLFRECVKYPGISRITIHLFLMLRCAHAHSLPLVNFHSYDWIIMYNNSFTRTKGLYKAMLIICF